jgi:hypothetical protein
LSIKQNDHDPRPTHFTETQTPLVSILFADADDLRDVVCRCVQLVCGGDAIDEET